MANRFACYCTFWRQVRQAFRTTGAVAPSSRYLARAISRPLEARTWPARVLEVGAGTGALTAAIVGRLQPGDRFDVVELNGAFVEVLQERFRSEPSFQAVAPLTRILHLDVQELTAQEPYDFIVSGLPLNNFRPGEVRGILGRLRRLSRSGTVLSFFEYFGLRRAKSLCVGRGERQRLGRVGRAIERYVRRYEFRRDLVLANLPPAVVHHLRF